MSRSTRARQKERITKQLPSVLSDLSGGRRQRGDIQMYPAGKPPKLRFQPGTFVELEEEVYHILYAFRLAQAPEEWVYCLELCGGGRAPWYFLNMIGAAQDTPRVVYELFLGDYDVLLYFEDIPMHRSRRNVTNRVLLNNATVVAEPTAVSV